MDEIVERARVHLAELVSVRRLALQGAGAA
jgi:hypothetical protein